MWPVIHAEPNWKIPERYQPYPSSPEGVGRIPTATEHFSMFSVQICNDAKLQASYVMFNFELLVLKGELTPLPTLRVLIRGSYSNYCIILTGIKFDFRFDLRLKSGQVQTGYGLR